MSFLDEVVKQVKIRVAMNDDNVVDKQFFIATVKAPSAAVLDSNNEAFVIIMGKQQFRFLSNEVKARINSPLSVNVGKRNCRNPPYFVPFNVSLHWHIIVAIDALLSWM